MSPARSVCLVTLGCARNEVDSEELAARLVDAGWRLADAGDPSDVVVVNTCGFVDAAKKDAVDILLTAAGSGSPVVAVGCLAERYGRELAAELPEATVLSFDDYPDIGDRLDDVLAGRPLVAHTPVDRRVLLPVAPVRRPAVAAGVSVPGRGAPGGAGPRVLRRRLDRAPVAPLKLASGCDRRCAFCAIPTFRGSFLSRPAPEVLTEAAWLAADGVRELVLVSENSTSYGKDLGDLRALEALLGPLAAVPGVRRVRVSYLQPAEMRPSLVQAIASTPGVAPYFDLSFQHASGPVLRRMRRFGDAGDFLQLVERIRGAAPSAGIRSNVIVGFPGETERDVEVLVDFLASARLDAVGVFGYSDEEGTEAAGLTGKHDEAEIAARVARVADVAEELAAQRAEERHGELVEVLVEQVGERVAHGRAAHQAPEVDGSVRVRGAGSARVGDLVSARVVGSAGVDLQAVAVGAPPP